MKGDRYPRQLFDQFWEVKTRRGRQRKMWHKRVDDVFKELLLDKEELWMILNNSSKSFLDECVNERAARKGLTNTGLFSRVNSRSTYIAVVMQGL